MDEPTAALGIRESQHVLKLAREVAGRGLSVVLISHILPHVMELADRVLVMRLGKLVAELTEEISSEDLVGRIVGVDAGDEGTKGTPVKNAQTESPSAPIASTPRWS